MLQKFNKTIEPVPDAAESSGETQSEPIFYSSEDVARILKCSVPTARIIMNTEDFPTVYIGKNLRVYKKAFEEWAMTRRPFKDN